MNYVYPNGDTIKVTLETTLLTPKTFLPYGKLWEHESLKKFFSYIDDNNHTIVDIGAQTGLYTLYAKWLPSCTFYAFEPFVDSYRCLKDNIELNDIKNVYTLPVAISDKTGTAILNTCKHHNGLHTMGKRPLRFTDVKPVKVNTITLDDMFSHTRVDFIKIDTEGYEYYILKGGVDVIKRDQPLIQIEYHEKNMKQCNVNPDEFMRFIKDVLGYHVVSHIKEEMIIAPVL